MTYIADINECIKVDLIECDPNAYCVNTRGSYTCVCGSGFTGDDKKCDGTWFDSLPVLVSIICITEQFGIQLIR